MALGLSGDGTLTGVDIAASGLGRVLQVVRATDTTLRQTTSTTLVDSGLSVTITPQESTSNVLLIAIVRVDTGGMNTGQNQSHAITDSANVAISGAEEVMVNQVAKRVNLLVMGYATPATTSPVTYKLRFCAQGGGTAEIENNGNTGQMYAIEVAA